MNINFTHVLIQVEEISQVTLVCPFLHDLSFFELNKLQYRIMYLLILEFF